MEVFKVVCSSRSGKRLPHPLLFCRPRESLRTRIDSRSFTTFFIPCQSHYTQQQKHKQDNFVIRGTIPSMCQGSDMELRVGQYAELHRKYTQADVNAFCEVSGDYNPVHYSLPVCDIRNVDTNTHDYHSQQYQQLQPYPRSIVHGVLLTSIFSTIFGTLIPGCMYRRQSFKFYHPVYVDEEVFGRVIVTRLRQINTRDSNDDEDIGYGGGVLCKCDTTIYKKVLPCNINSNNNETADILCIDGEAQVWIPNSALKDD